MPQSGAPAASACCTAVAAAAQQWWAMVAAAQLLQPGDSKKYHDARAGLLVVHWGQQGWTGWGGGA
jgi:hypothetical protein